MFKHYFEGISGIEIYPIILLLVFVLFFVSMFIYLMRTGKFKLDEISRIPLGENSEQTEPSKKIIQ
ncbi:hypothetical protein BH11BAC1_BH11BAC1_14900 [soil metagenome]